MTRQAQDRPARLPAVPGSSAPEPLLAASWTSAGDASPLGRDRLSPVSFRRRVEAAAAVGFTGMGFGSGDLEVAEATYGVAGMAEMLRDHGITHVEVESTMARRAGLASREPDVAWARALRLTEQLGAATLKVTPRHQEWTLMESLPSPAELLRRTRQAEGAGARLAILVPAWATEHSMRDVVGLVDRARHPNLRLVVDSWVVERESVPHHAVAAMAPSVVSVELSDGVRASLHSRTDAVRSRRYCGEGEFHLAALVSALRGGGFTGPWGVQILADRHRSLSTEEALRRAAVSARTLLSSVAEPQLHAS